MRLLLVFAGLVLAGIVIVYLAVPQIQPCALLSRLLPPNLLPPNPNVVDPSFQPLPGARAVFGECACSGYRIEVPEKWNGNLVVYAHGFRNATTKLTVTDLPVRRTAIREGFAWAASSYRANGFNPQDGVDDTLLLIEQFKKRVGTPKRILIYGSSMGGHVVVASLEQHAEVYGGGMAECGVVSGAGELDYLVGVNTLADYLAGADMLAPENQGWKAQIDLLKQRVYPELGRPPSFVFNEDGLRGAVTPAPRIKLTAKGEMFRDAQINLSGGHRPFAQEGFASAYRMSLETVRALFGLQPHGAVAAGTNVETKYQIDPGFGLTSNALNRGVRWAEADPKEREIFSFTGKLKAPLLTLDDTGDLFVPILNAQIYRRLAESAGSGSFLVQRSVRRFLHCDFSDAERDRSFLDLVKWVDGGARPAGEDLLGPLINAGRQWTEPLRPDDPGRP